MVDIRDMNMADLEVFKDRLLEDFDDFWNIAVLENELQNENSKYIVAKINDDIVGFAGIWKSVDDIHITNIVVKKNSRNKGIGSILLEELIEIAKKQNIMSITLEVNSTNYSAVKLYTKYGFKKVGLRKKYYHNQDDALIMTLYF